MSKEVSENVLPFVTTWDADSAPCAWKRELVLSVMAHQAAVPVVVIVPSVIAVDETLRPLGEPAAGAPKAPPAAKDLKPNKWVVVACAYVVGSDEHKITCVDSVSRTLSPRSSTRSSRLAAMDHVSL